VSSCGGIAGKYINMWECRPGTREGKHGDACSPMERVEMQGRVFSAELDSGDKSPRS